ncbi:MAG: hypothetical protein RLZZ09_2023, partial [Pseudomonadota bacterium]
LHGHGGNHHKLCGHHTDSTELLHYVNPNSHLNTKE